MGKKIKFFKNEGGEEYQIAGNFIHPLSMGNGIMVLQQKYWPTLSTWSSAFGVVNILIEIVGENSSLFVILFFKI